MQIMSSMCLIMIEMEKFLLRWLFFLSFFFSLIFFFIWIPCVTVYHIQMTYTVYTSILYVKNDFIMKNAHLDISETRKYVVYKRDGVNQMRL